MEEGELIPLLIAAGGGGNAYMEDPDFNPDLVQLEQYDNSTAAPSSSGQTGAAGKRSHVCWIQNRPCLKFSVNLEIVEASASSRTEKN